MSDQRENFRKQQDEFLEPIRRFFVDTTTGYEVVFFTPFEDRTEDLIELDRADVLRYMEHMIGQGYRLLARMRSKTEPRFLNVVVWEHDFERPIQPDVEQSDGDVVAVWNGYQK